jgi:hypothetical protein
MALVLGHGPFAKQFPSGRPTVHSNQARAKSTRKLALSFDREFAQTSITDLSTS